MSEVKKMKLYSGEGQTQLSALPGLKFFIFQIFSVFLQKGIALLICLLQHELSIGNIHPIQSTFLIAGFLESQAQHMIALIPQIFA